MIALLTPREMPVARTAEMFDKPKIRRRVLMHWDDAGYDGDKPIGNFVCQKCGHRAGWLRCSEAEMRGVPCPKCNAGQPGANHE